MFKANAIPTTLLRTQDDKRVNESFINMWTDFAVHHNPTPKDNSWSKFDPKYLEIGSKFNTMKYPENHKNSMVEWKEIWEKTPPTMSHTESSTWKNSNKF